MVGTRTRSGLAVGPASLLSISSTASGSASAGAPSTSATGRELRPRRDARGGRGAPPGATHSTPRAAPRIGGPVTRRLAAQSNRANPSDILRDNSAVAPPPPPPPLPQHQHQQSSSSFSSRRSRPSHTRPARPPPPPPAETQPAQLVDDRRRTKRSRPQSGFYEEDTDDDDDEDEEEEDSDGGQDADNAYISPSPDPETQPKPKRAAVAIAAAAAASAVLTATTHRTRSKGRRSKHGKAKLSRATKRRRVDSSTVEKLKPRSDETAANADAVIPNWVSLPYYVLVDVFQYASASFSSNREAVNWLLSTSRICRAFAEPALTALYQCPALLSRSMAHSLLEHLSRDPATTTFNYRAKVEKLRIDVAEIAAKTYRGQPLDFGALVRHLPRLKVIDFWHEKDLPPYRNLDDNLRWHYPNTLFEAMNDPQAPLEDGRQGQPTRLAGWRWNGRMMGPGFNLANVKSLHLTPAFASLKKLCFVNYQLPSLRARGDADEAEISAQDDAFIQSMADAISVLPDLEYLSIECSTVVTGNFLPLLPKTIRTLELINCWEINGEDFATYLVTHGQKLQHLHLHHNQSLDLSFLTVLGTACPNLQTLCMDLKTYSHHEFYHDSEPNYDNVLTPDQAPHWSQGLETIELKNMRKWSADAAEVFFQSLVDCAPRLPQLRCLDLKTMLDIPFRQRSALRDKWDMMLKKVFLRKLSDPRPFFTLRSNQSGEKDSGKSTRTARRSQNATASPAEPSPSRRSSRRVAATSGIPGMQTTSPSSRASSIGRDLRNGITRPSYAEPDTDDDEDDLESSEQENADESDEKESLLSSPPSSEADVFRQGMCEKVEIFLDNQKPTETTFNMNDFLDDELSDDLDEDWDGDVDDDAGYAW
ncbi:hypothetical protein B0T22DRAFT_468632 [Podospora appendiculata]|uniref:Uncharacterized protein n=1 Tax=Podospora appendiculata TaxID=314037 RepID=A0AAE0X2N1_9PEZI|nr:hypothetical protein B0T22DRAFT_468632 [Podospora appendiculata]